MIGDSELDPVDERDVPLQLTIGRLHWCPDGEAASR